jgi:hypothetical protein
MGFLEIDEIVALSFGRDPRHVNPGALKSVEYPSSFVKKYQERKVLVERALASGSLGAPTTPIAAVEWLKLKGLEFPPEWEDHLPAVNSAPPKHKNRPNTPHSAERDPKVYSGGTGRPSSMHFVVREAERRIKTEPKNLPETLEAFSNELSDWRALNHPSAPSLTPKTIRNKIRGLWHGRKNGDRSRGLGLKVSPK